MRASAQDQVHPIPGNTGCRRKPGVSPFHLCRNDAEKQVDGQRMLQLRRVTHNSPQSSGAVRVRSWFCGGIFPQLYCTVRVRVLVRVPYCRRVLLAYPASLLRTYLRSRLRETAVRCARAPARARPPQRISISAYLSYSTRTSTMYEYIRTKRTRTQFCTVLVLVRVSIL